MRNSLEESRRRNGSEQRPAILEQRNRGVLDGNGKCELSC